MSLHDDPDLRLLKVRADVKHRIGLLADELYKALLDAHYCKLGVKLSVRNVKPAAEITFEFDDPDLEKA